MKNLLCVMLVLAIFEAHGSSNFNCQEWLKKYEELKLSNDYKNLLKANPKDLLTVYRVIASEMSTGEFNEALFLELERTKNIDLTQKLIGLNYKGGLPIEILTIFSDDTFENEKPKIPLKFLTTIDSMRQKACLK